MNYFLSIQNTYDAIEIALFKNSTCLEIAQENKIYASKNFCKVVDNLLNNNNLTLNDLSFLAVNQGPGPFTTLRVVISWVNGLSFATNIPLIGIDGLEALLEEYVSSDHEINIAILNAFNKDVYFAIQEKDIITNAGCKNIDVFLNELKITYTGQAINFLGNATLLYLDNIRTILGKHAIIHSPIPLHCSVKQVGMLGLKKWQEKQGVSHRLMPLYLKHTISGIQ